MNSVDLMNVFSFRPNHREQKVGTMFRLDLFMSWLVNVLFHSVICGTQRASRVVNYPVAVVLSAVCRYVISLLTVIYS